MEQETDSKRQVAYNLRKSTIRNLNRFCETSEPPTNKSSTVDWIISKFLEDHFAKLETEKLEAK